MERIKRYFNRIFHDLNGRNFSEVRRTIDKLDWKYHHQSGIYPIDYLHLYDNKLGLQIAFQYDPSIDRYIILTSDPLRNSFNSTLEECFELATTIQTRNKDIVASVWSGKECHSKIAIVDPLGTSGNGRFKKSKVRRLYRKGYRHFILPSWVPEITNMPDAKFIIMNHSLTSKHHNVISWATTSHEKNEMVTYDVASRLPVPSSTDIKLINVTSNPTTVFRDKNLWIDYNDLPSLIQHKDGVQSKHPINFIMPYYPLVDDASHHDYMYSDAIEYMKSYVNTGTKPVGSLTGIVNLDGNGNRIWHTFVHGYVYQGNITTLQIFEKI